MKWRYNMAKNSLAKSTQDMIITSMTYNPLSNALRLNDKNNLFKSNVANYHHKTGFPLFDYYFGSLINIHDATGAIIRQDPLIGQKSGTFNIIVGNSGSGKTTWTMQIAANMIRQFKTSQCFHYDLEQRTDITRAETVTKLPIEFFDEENGRYIINQGMIGLDTIQETIVKLYAEKMHLKNEISYKTGQMNEFNKEIEILEPTIIILDSVAQILNETFSVDNQKELNKATALRGNTEGARDAKSLKGFFKDILPLCKEANIIIYGINHLNANMSMNAFTGPTKHQNYLKQDEAMPGGKNLIYNSANIAKLTAKTADDFTESTDGFAGFTVMVEPVKCSSNQSGNDSKGVSFEMVFSHKDGFDSLRSLILYGREKGIIEGNKPKMKFKEDDSFTFSFKNCYAEMLENPNLWKNIVKYIIPELQTHLSYVQPEPFNDELLNY